MNTKDITYEKASAVRKQNASDWMTSRPDDLSSVHTGLAETEEAVGFAEVNIIAAAIVQTAILLLIGG
ncbi:MAG: hypothetical protein ACOXZV_06685 [Bacteroidales bacterium]|jgi:hypothetical protein